MVLQFPIRTKVQRQPLHQQEMLDTDEEDDADADNEYAIKHNRVCAKIIELFRLQVREIFEDEA